MTDFLVCVLAWQAAPGWGGCTFAVRSEKYNKERPYEVHLKFIHAVLANLFMLLLTACGGGGGATGITGNAGLGGTVTNGVSITAANAPNVAAAVLNTLAAATGATAGAASATPQITGVVVNPSGSRFSLPALLLGQLARLPDLQYSTNSTGIVGAAVGLNQSCAISGSVLLSGVIADPNFMTLTDGDILSASYFLCNEIGVLLDGDVDLVVENPVPLIYDGTPPYTIDLNTVFTALRALDGVDYYYADGDMLVTIDDDSTGTGDIRMTLTGNALDTSYNNHDQLITANPITTTPYFFDLSGNVNTGLYSFDFNGIVESRDIDGTVTFTTVTPFTGDENSGVEATAGELDAVSDLDNTKVKLIAQPDGINVELRVDADANGSFEITGIMRTWAELAAL